MPSFLDLGVPAVLADVLAADGKTEAFAIQRDTLPDSLAGRDLPPVGTRLHIAWGAADSWVLS